MKQLRVVEAKCDRHEAKLAKLRLKRRFRKQLRLDAMLAVLVEHKSIANANKILHIATSPVVFKVVVASAADHAACLSVSSLVLRARTQTRLGGLQFLVCRLPQRSGCRAFAAA